MLRNTLKLIGPIETMAIKYLPLYTHKEYMSSIRSCNNYRRNNGRQISLALQAKALGPVDLRRNIFTLEEKFNIRLQKEKLGIPDAGELRDRIETNFRESGINKLFVEDSQNLLLLAEDAKHLQLIADIIQSFFEDDYRLDVIERVSLVSTFISMCIHLNELDIAQSFWNQSNIELYKRRLMTLKYYTFLYDNGMYDELITDYNKETIRLNGTKDLEPHSVVVLAALARLGTNEALGKMSDIVAKQSLYDKGLIRRSIALCSWLAFKLNNFGMAYDLLTSKLKYGGLHYAIINLKLAILIETGRLHEATVLLRTSLNRQAYNNSEDFRNVTICYDTMKRYTIAIKEQNEEDFTKDAIRICQIIDERANLTDRSLEEIIFEPIDKDLKIMKDKRRERIRRQGITGSQH